MLHALQLSHRHTRCISLTASWQFMRHGLGLHYKGLAADNGTNETIFPDGRAQYEKDGEKPAALPCFATLVFSLETAQDLLRSTSAGLCV